MKENFPTLAIVAILFTFVLILCLGFLMNPLFTPFEAGTVFSYAKIYVLNSIVENTTYPTSFPAYFNQSNTTGYIQDQAGYPGIFILMVNLALVLGLEPVSILLFPSFLLIGLVLYAFTKNVFDRVTAVLTLVIFFISLDFVAANIFFLNEGITIFVIYLLLLILNKIFIPQQKNLVPVSVVFLILVFFLWVSYYTTLIAFFIFLILFFVLVLLARFIHRASRQEQKPWQRYGALIFGLIALGGLIVLGGFFPSFLGRVTENVSLLLRDPLLFLSGVSNPTYSEIVKKSNVADFLLKIIPTGVLFFLSAVLSFKIFFKKLVVSEQQKYWVYSLFLTGTIISIFFYLTNVSNKIPRFALYFLGPIAAFAITRNGGKKAFFVVFSIILLFLFSTIFLIASKDFQLTLYDKKELGYVEWARYHIPADKLILTDGRLTAVSAFGNLSKSPHPYKEKVLLDLFYDTNAVQTFGLYNYLAISEKMVTYGFVPFEGLLRPISEEAFKKFDKSSGLSKVYSNGEVNVYAKQ